MTLANRITLARLLAIPLFVLLAVYYGKSVAEGRPQEWQRAAAIAVFVLAAVSDGLDGWVARRFNQRTPLGAALDPIADKGLLLAAIITLSVSNWSVAFPLWFPVLVITRDAVILLGCALLHHLEGKLEVRPSWLGKAATAAQMAAVAWVMLQVQGHEVIVGLAGAFTFLSGVDYICRGLRLLRTHGRQGGAPQASGKSSPTM